MSEQIKAIEIRPADFIEGRKVVWAIPNYLRDGKTEVKFEDGETKFLSNNRQVMVVREAAN